MIAKPLLRRNLNQAADAERWSGQRDTARLDHYDRETTGGIDRGVCQSAATVAPTGARPTCTVSVRHVRMYNVGFGDCFLLTIGNGDRPLRILFDCGSIAADPAVSMDDAIERLWADATDDGADTHVSM